MKAVVVERPKATPAVREMSQPTIGPRDVLIKVRACGVCHSDLHLANGDWEWDIIKFPLILGHEVAGVVEEIGKEVDHLQRGAKVGMPWLYATCGRCRECLRGEEILCAALQGTGVTVPGGYAEYLKAPADYVTVFPETLSFVDAAPLFCAGVTSFSGLRNAHTTAGQRVAVFGIGGLGHLGVLYARAMGCEVIAISRKDEKLTLAQRLGAHHLINAEQGKVAQALQDLGGADVILAPTIATEQMGEVLGGLAPDGTLMILGAAPGSFSVSPDVMISGRRKIIGSPAGSRKDLRDCLAFSARHTIRPMIETYPLEQTAEVFQRIKDDRVRFRAVLTPA
ncbi:MAG: alcohol dehydrogenase catalytic domain-containing protein [Candidatus Methylomirabilales bacterium]